MTAQGGSVLIVVEHRQPHLHRHLRDLFGAHADVQIVLDRRVAQRRRRPGERDDERRRQPRRARPQADVELRELGWAVVRLTS
jgi:hypothetical protein